VGSQVVGRQLAVQLVSSFSHNIACENPSAILLAYILSSGLI